MLQAEYIKDMHNNYLILKGVEDSTSKYGVKMLLNNSIKGLLKIELRCIDQMNLFYYDITSKISLSSAYNNKSMIYIEIRTLLSNIFDIIENSEKYLLSEDDFILDPNFIYMDSDNNTVFLCHLIGYKENIQNQIVRLIEYLMNKVDYQDDKAVLLIYAMYKKSKESSCTFDKLLNELNKEFIHEKLNTKLNKDNDKNDIEMNDNNMGNETNKLDRLNNKMQNIEPKSSSYDKKQQHDKNSITQNIHIKNKNSNNLSKNYKNSNNKNSDNKLEPINPLKTGMQIIKGLNSKKVNENITKPNELERTKEVESEIEVLMYTKKTYILSGISAIVGTITFIIALNQKVLHNSFGTQLDMTKLLCCLIIIGCMEIYVLTKLWDKKNMLPRIVTNYQRINEDDNLDVDNLSEWNKDYINSSEIYSDENMNNIECEVFRNNDTQDCYDDLVTKGKQDCYDDLVTKGNLDCYDDLETKSNLKSYEKLEIKNKISFQADINDQDKTVALANLTPYKEYYLCQCHLCQHRLLHNNLEQCNLEHCDICQNNLDRCNVNLYNSTENVSKVLIQKFPYVIGKSERYVDFVISDPSVSRLHARFTREEDTVYLTDLNSTNGTYINGSKLKTDTPYSLNNNDEIIFAKIKYTILEVKPQ